MMIRKILKQSALLIPALIVTIAGSIVFGLIPPLILEKIINSLTGGINVALKLALLYFAMIAVSGLFDAVKESLITIFGQNTTKVLRQEMCRKLSLLPADYYIKNQPGITVSRFVNDVDTVEDLFAAGIISMFVDGCKVVSIIIMIFVKSRGLGILMVLVTPLLFLMTRVFQKKMLKAQMENRVAVGKVNNHVPETIKNIRMIHSYHKEKYMEDRYEGYIQESYRAVEKSNFYDAIYSPIILVVSAVIVAVMMVLSATGGNVRTFFGMSVGTAVAVIAYVGKVFDPLESIGMEIQSIQSAVAGVKRIREFLSESEREETDESITWQDMMESREAAITLSRVDFGYDEDELVLKDFSMKIDRGDNITLAGRTGAGKSTVFKLLMGLYTPVKGNVKIFGVDAERIPDHEKRRIFGYVEQSFRLVPGTIEDQITLFDENISHEDVVRAAEIAGLHQVIEGFDKGYDTYCKENIFSQGQMQLLSIARAVAANPMILLLDEITANLDSDTEKKVLEALDKASENRTVLSISHRLYEHSGGKCIYIGKEQEE